MYVKPERYQVWEVYAGKPDRLVGEYGHYAAAVNSITHVSRDRELHGVPLSWFVCQASDGIRLMERANGAARRSRTQGGSDDH